MRNIRLNPEELTVEAFTTSEATSAQGTVRGHDDDSTFDPNSISGWDNCICPRQMGTYQMGC